MAASIKWYGKSLIQILNKEVEFDEANKIKLALCTSSYTPDQDAHDYFDDITNEVAASGGYSAGGAVIANCAVTYASATNTIKLDGDDVVWAGSTITARYGIIYYDTGVAATSPLLAYVDFGGDVSSSSSDFTVAWSTSGILTAVIG